MNNTNEELRQLVKASSFTHRQVATAIGMDYHLFSRAMAGSVDFTPAQLARISEFLKSQSASTAAKSAPAVTGTSGVRKMTTGNQCPRCGTVNEPSRFTCSKCYASLKAVKSIVSESDSRIAKPSLGLANTLKEMSFYSKLCVFGTIVSFVAILGVSASDEDRLKAISHVSAMILSAIGIVATIRAGGLDLSVAGVAALAGMLTVFSGKYQMSLGVVVGLATGLLAGWANGALVTRLRFNPGLITLSMGVGLSSLVLSYTQNDPSFSAVASLAGMATAALGPFPLIVLLVVATALLMRQWVRKTDFSNTVPNADGAFRGTQLAAEQAYMLSGTLAGLTGMTLVSLGNTPGEIAQSGWHLFPLAAAIAGGAVIRESRANILHAVLGGSMVGALTWYVGTVGVTSMQLLLAAVAIIGLITLDHGKEVSWSELRTSMRHNPRAAMRNTGTGFAVLAASCFIIYDAATRVPPESAVVVNAGGTISVRHGESDFIKVDAKTSRVILRSRDAIRTGPQAAAMLKLSNGSVIKVASSTEMEFGELCQMNGQTLVTRMRMNFGRVYARVAEVASGEQNFEVQTPTAVAAVRGTMWSIASGGGNDYVSVNDGLVAVTAAQRTQHVAKGQASRITAGAAPTPPEDMSWEERSAWVHEEQDLLNPAAARLAEPKDQGRFLSDNFDATTLNPLVWYLRGDAGVTVKPVSGRLQVSGVPARAQTTYGALSLPFSMRVLPVVEGVVSVANRGTGQAVFRLTDRRGSTAGVTLTLSGREGYALRSAEAPTQVRQGRPFGDPAGWHRVSLRYDASTATVIGSVDGSVIGSVPAGFQNKEAHFELLSEAAEAGKTLEVRFEDFQTNVVLPADDLVERIVGVGTRGGSATPTNILALAPLTGQHGLQNVVVKYPKKSNIGLESRTFIQSTYGESELKYDAASKSFLKEEPGVLPGQGDFAFRTLTAEKRESLKFLKYEDPKEFPRLAVQASKGATGQLVVQWSAVPKADAYWVEVRDEKTHAVFALSDLLAANATSWTLMSRELLPTKQYYVVVVAHRFHPSASSPNLSAWQQALKPLARWTAPTHGLFVNVASPQGQDEFVAQATGKLIW